MDKTIEMLLVSAASSSTSCKKKVGAIILGEFGDYKCSGYNHDIYSPAGPCENHELQTYDSVIHAEMACLNNFDATFGCGTTPNMSAYKMYITHAPCLSCQAALKKRNCNWEVRKKMPEIQTEPYKEIRGDVAGIAIGVDATLQQRGSVYGAFKDNANCTQELMDLLYAQMAAANREFANFEVEALHMICHKISRIVCGLKTKKDNWHDIAGYAKLAEDLTTDQ